jgi:hypothetical protein
MTADIDTGIDSWDALIARFRALGGVFDNITLRETEHGRGLFPIDPRRACALHVPNALLVPADDVEVRDGRLTLAAASPVDATARGFFEAYHRVTSWADGGRASTEAFFAGLDRLPPACKALMAKDLALEHWFETIDDAMLLRHFVNARRLTTGGRVCLAPVLELSNHDPKGPKMVSTAAALTLTGRFEREVAWRYRTADSFQMFRAYRFPSVERFGFSLPFEVFDKRLGLKIRVGADTTRRDAKPAPAPLPLVTRTANTVEVSFLLLGDRADPRNPLMAFKETLGPHLGAGTLEFFEGLLFYNRQKFFELMASVETDDAPMSATLRKVCRIQLETLSMNSFQ